MFKTIRILVFLFLTAVQVAAMIPQEYDYSLKPGGSSRKLVVTFRNVAETAIVDLPQRGRLYKIGKNLYTCEPYTIKGDQQSYWDIRALNLIERKFNPVTFQQGNNITNLGVSNNRLYILILDSTIMKVLGDKVVPIEDPSEKAIAFWLFHRSHL